MRLGEVIVGLLVLVAALAVYSLERWMKTPDGPLVGSAHVADGDTLTVAGTRVRLVDIDAPELEQVCSDAQRNDWPCGREAMSRLRSLVDGKSVSCVARSRDPYGRALAVCTLPDKTDINAWMVRQGFALNFGHSNAYGEEEAEAKAAKRGLWAGNFTMPREWRRQHPRKD